MVLGFKAQFEKPVIDGDKIHTIRHDIHDRWKSGRSIQFATGVRTKKYKKFKDGECLSTQKIKIKWKKINIGLVSESWTVKVFIDGKDITVKGDIVDQLVKNDGFANNKEFFEWKAWYRKDFTGKIVHWTKLKY